MSRFYVIPGKPVGYVRTTRTSKFHDPRYKKYAAYKGKIQLLLGVDIDFWKAHAADKKKIRVTTFSYFEHDGSRPDAENVQKGVCDAIFYKCKRGDRNVCGAYDFGFDKWNPRVEIRVELA